MNIPPTISLRYFQEDLVAETKATNSTTSKQLAALQASYKATQQSSRGNRKKKKKPTTDQDDDKESKSQVDASFTVDFRLDTGSFNDYGTNQEAPEPIEAPEAHRADHDSKKQWLFDTGSTVHICNDKSLFTTLNQSSDCYGTVKTGGGPVPTKGIGTVQLQLFTGMKNDQATYSTINLTKVLYVPTFPLNIISGERLYKSGGALGNNKIYSADHKIIARLDIPKNGFFLTVKGINTVPKASNWLCYNNTEDAETPEITEGAGAKEPTTAQLKHQIKQAILWHTRLGHIGLDLLKKTARIINGMPNLQKVQDHHFHCRSCDTAKMLRRPSKQAVADPPKVLGRLEGDIVTIAPTALNKKAYALIFVERKSRFRFIRLLITKDQAATEARSLIEHLWNTYGQYPAHIHYDGGREILVLKPYLINKGITFSESSAYAHNQNGLAERHIRVILERLRASMIASGLPLTLWSYTIGSIVDIINQTATTNRDLTPYQLFHDELSPATAPHLPRLEIYKAIGTEVLVHIPEEKRAAAKKMDPRAQKGHLLAVLGTQTYLVWLGGRKVIQTSFIKLYERPEQQTTTPPKLALPMPPTEPSPPVTTEHLPPVATEPLPPVATEPLPPAATEPNLPEIEIPLPQATKQQREEFQRFDDEMDTSELITHLVALAHNYRSDKTSSRDLLEPKNFKEALKHPEKEHYLQASFTELKQLLITKTLYFVKRSEARKSPITSRWVYKHKKDQLGETIKYKARLVARGFQQIFGIDFSNTYAATTGPPTWRIILALAAIFSWNTDQIDFVGAFLNSQTDYDIYITIPEGLYEFSLTGPEAVNLLKQHGWDPTEDQVILLKRSLYGLKQAGYLWQQSVVTLVKSLGFTPLTSDIATYYNPATNIFIISHVDDCLLVGPETTEIQALKDQLQKVYDIEDLGQAEYFLGIQIQRHRPSKSLWIHQKSYITEAIRHFGLPEHGPEIPLSPGLTGRESPSPNLSQKEAHLYSQLVGTANYAVTQTRGDCGFALQWLSRQLQNPTVAHLKAAKKLLSYMSETKDLAIHYQPTGDLSPEGYCDSDFAGCHKTAKSTYGYLFKLAGGPISWKCKRATTVALSTLEAEYDGLLEGCREALWLRGLFKEIQRPLQDPTPLKGDNQGAIETAHSAKHHSRTKHTLLKFQAVREAVQAGHIAVSYIPTADMPADGLTKALPVPKHKLFLLMFGLDRPPTEGGN